MTAWNSDELTAIAGSDELEIAPERTDGTRRRPNPVWVVRDGDELYVRSARGVDGIWWRTARASHSGHISAGGVDRDVTFVEVAGDRELNDRIDAAYRSKYGGYSATYVDPMVADSARVTTLRLQPA
ncbi:DUF2255 family protein [Streptomyces sp. 4N509B]|uniref:DUF2255 family protein n=1 Tax=Streptomyces sp. 4N509B TaxID=3457413 RepID=UPI003FD32E65